MAVTVTELTSHINAWYACSACVPDIFNALQAYFGIPFCGDWDCNATAGEDCSTCQQDCGNCTVIPESPQDYVAYWKFEGNANDETGLNDGTLMDNTQIISDAQKGNVLSLDGDMDYVDCGDIDIDEGIGAFTVSAWINTGGQPASNQRPVSRYTDSNNFIWYFNIFTDGDISFGVQTSSGAANGEYKAAITDANWHHIVGVYSGSSVSVYVDGSPGSIQNALTGNTVTISSPLTIGALRPVGTYFNGMIDDVMIYGRALNETEILEIFSAQGGVIYCTDDTGCSSEGGFCEAGTDIPYTCLLGGDGCLDRTDGTACIAGTETCQDGACVPSGEPSTMNYEGFGSVTKGAEDCPTGYEAYIVTKLADDGTVGTLRDAVSVGCRYIKFDLGGTITLSSTLTIDESYITIAGETAPSPGITIEQPNSYGTRIMPDGKDAHDIIIRYLRNKGTGGYVGDPADIWGLDGMDGHVYNIVIDHVTGISSGDGVFDVYGEISNVTISWNLIMDSVAALHLSYHPQNRERISFHHNVFARNNERQVKMRHHNDLIDYVNNVVYGWAWLNAGGYGLRMDTNDPSCCTNDEYPNLNVENNVFHYVAGLYGNEDDAIVRDNPTGKVYFAGNILPPGENDNYSTSARHAIPSYAAVTKYDASTLGNTVVPFAGTHYPTQEEQALINEIRAAICVPDTCTSLGHGCDTWNDGCGSPLDCGSCGPGDYCNNGNCVPVGTECSNDDDCYYKGPGFICNAGNFCEWDPPIGVPKPSFGIEETVDMYIGQQYTFTDGRGTIDYPISSVSGKPYTHYVDNTPGLGCTDDNNDYGTPNNPRCTITQTFLPEGSVVEVHGGPYTGPDGPVVDYTIWMRLSGTSEHPVFIRGVDNPVLTLRVRAHGDYGIIEGFDFDNASLAFKDGDSDFLAVRHSEFHNSNLYKYGVLLDSVCRDVVVYSNHIHDYGDWQSPEEGDLLGVSCKPAVGSSRMWIVDNHIHHMQGDGVTTARYPEDVYVGRNILHHSRENAIDMKGVTNLVFSENICYGYGATHSSGGDAVRVNDEGINQNVWIIFNEIYDSRMGANAGGATGGPYIIGNKIYNLSLPEPSIRPENDGCGIRTAAGHVSHVFNNVIYNVQKGIFSENSNDIMANNIISNASEYHLRGNFVINNSLMWQNGEPITIWGAASCNDCIEADPQFLSIDPANPDFLIPSSTSPAIDAGIESDVYQTFYDFFGVDIKKDIEGRTCPQDGDNNGTAEWDIGAYEFVG